MFQATSRATSAGAYRSPATPAPQSGFGGLTVPLHWLVDHWQRIQAIRELNRLSDRHLRDIGIAARGDIDTIADEMIRRRRR
ncbi:MAG: DUF1127 domain-containing protein [Dongiaceae bacterium]